MLVEDFKGCCGAKIVWDFWNAPNGDEMPYPDESKARKEEYRSKVEEFLKEKGKLFNNMAFLVAILNSEEERMVGVSLRNQGYRLCATGINGLHNSRLRMYVKERRPLKEKK